MLFSSSVTFLAFLLTANALALPLVEDALANPELVEARDVEERAAGQFTFYRMLTPVAGPCDLAAGPDGALWGEDILVNKIFRVDPKTGVVTEYPIPYTTGIQNVTIPGVPKIVQDRTAFSCAIRTCGDGNIYASNGIRNQLVKINPTTKKITVISYPGGPTGNLFPFNDITPYPGGLFLTQTTGNVFQFYNFTTQKFTTYNVPTPLALPLGLKVADSNGLLYVAEFNANKILEFNPKTKAINEYPLPLPAQYPAVVRGELNGYIYFSLFTGNGIGRINTSTKKIDLYPSGQLGGLGAVDTQDSKGGVWLSYFNIDAMARLNTTTFKYTYVPFPGTFAAGGISGAAGNVPPYVDISVNYGPGDAIWFGSITNNLVGRYSLS